MEVQNLAKWISELQAQIDQVKRMAIAAAASGGDAVTITPSLESGTKIADYTIGEETSGSLYAPEVAVTPELVSGIKLADYAIGETTGSVYCPNMVGICDYDNIVVPTTALSAQVNYTATEDCVFWLSVKNAANSDANIAINSKNAYGIYGPAMTQYMSFPLAKGDTITSSGLQFDQYTTYRVYKVKHTDVSPTTSTKRRKK